MAAHRASFLIFVLLLTACSPQAATPTVPALPPDTPTALPSSTAPAVTSIAVASPSAISSPTPAPALVSVSAVKGNLYIRRGPDTAYNPVAVLASGQSARALSRDVLEKWVQIAIPADPGRTGWVSIQTSYSAVSGDVSGLPEIQPTDWPVPAFLRNCTYHDMTAEPGGILIPALTNFPANDVRIDPGTYRVYDNEVDGYPEVLKVELREGSAIDIRVDGNGFKKKCPEP